MENPSYHRIEILLCKRIIKLDDAGVILYFNYQVIEKYQEFIFADLISSSIEKLMCKKKGIINPINKN